MDSIGVIPLVDLKEAHDRDVLQRIHEAFSEVGFVYIKHSLITKELIDNAFRTSREFFDLPYEAKKQYSRTSNQENNGYVELQQERLDPKRPPDLKECFNITDVSVCPYLSQVANFKEVIQTFFERCLELSNIILENMSVSLKLQDPKFFVNCHKKSGKGSKFNFTTLRLLHYPAVNTETLLPGQVRCGEHVDYGSITLLFQDRNGGLQVKTAKGTFIDVPYIEGAALVNLGALMQQWTSDQYLATPHRVLVPSDEALRGKVRQSIAFFVHPDNSTLVECIDGSNKYPPITAAEDIAQRFSKTYNTL